MKNVPYSHLFFVNSPKLLTCPLHPLSFTKEMLIIFVVSLHWNVINTNTQKCSFVLILNTARGAGVTMCQRIMHINKDDLPRQKLIRSSLFVFMFFLFIYLFIYLCSLFILLVWIYSPSIRGQLVCDDFDLYIKITWCDKERTLYFWCSLVYKASLRNP